MENGMDPVVQQLFGIDVRFSARSGKFWAVVPSGKGGLKAKLETKTIDEMEQQIAVTFVPQGEVEVYSWSGLSTYSTIGDLREPEPVKIKGFEIEKTRGRYAQKYVRYKTDKGLVGINQHFYRSDPQLAKELKALKAEYMRAREEYTQKARELAKRFVSVSAEEILAELSADHPENRVREGEGNEPINLDVFRQAFGKEDSDK